MEMSILSVQEQTFKDRQTGAPTTMYKCFLLMNDGGVGSIYSRVPRKSGDKLSLRIAASSDGKLAVRCVE